MLSLFEFEENVDEPVEVKYNIYINKEALEFKSETKLLSFPYDQIQYFVNTIFMSLENLDQLKFRDDKESQNYFPFMK